MGKTISLSKNSLGNSQPEKNKSLPTIHISEGDPTGINYEMMDALSHHFVLLERQFRIIFYKANHSFFPRAFQDATGTDPKQLGTGLYVQTVDCLDTTDQSKIRLGNPSEASGAASYYSLQVAMTTLKSLGGNLITLPLSKQWVKQSGQKEFVGHTEELAKFFKKKTFMMMTGPNLKVNPLTTHIPLVKVPEVLKKLDVKSFITALKNSKLLNSPKIGILGLNPHAGENGKVGTEEKTLLAPLISKLRKSGFTVSEPISADSAFLPEERKKYDLFLSAYHDQGLIPFKLLEGKEGVNITLGLDFVRVSPDHGPAFAIAGKKLADATSLKTCLQFCKLGFPDANLI